MTDPLRVPIGLDAESQWVLPSQATKQTDYRCPECNEAIRVREEHARNGFYVTRHFYHVRPGACSSESEDHYKAKWALAAHLRYFFEGNGPVLRIRRICPRYHALDVPLISIETNDLKIEVEKNVSESLRRPDVLWTQRGVPIGGVEIVHRHAVDVKKFVEYKKMKFPWVELRAADVLAALTSDAGTLLQPTQDQFPKWTCERCEKAKADEGVYVKKEPPQVGLHPVKKADSADPGPYRAPAKRGRQAQSASKLMGSTEFAKASKHEALRERLEKIRNGKW